MTLIKTSLAIAATTALAALVPQAQTAESPGSTRPNIILIMTDHHRPDHLNEKYTPNLAKLAGEGVRFQHAYTAAPTCQPARTSIITGLYPSQTGILRNDAPPMRDELRDDTFMNHLQKAGYYTAVIGKTHYIDAFGDGVDVVKRDAAALKKYGIDYLVQCADVNEHVKIPAHNWKINVDDYIYYLREKGLEKTYLDNLEAGLKSARHPLNADDTEDGFIGMKACEFINNYDQSKPFYLNVSFIGPHPPFMSPGEPKILPKDTAPPIGDLTDGITKKLDITQNAPLLANIATARANYANLCLHVDNYVGKIVDTLKAKNLLDNTVIIFVADHGEMLGDFGLWNKRFYYEQSAGVPMFITGNVKGRNIRGKAGAVSKSLVSALDIYPTILSLAGVEKDAGKQSGKNLLEIIRNVDSSYRKAVFSMLGTQVMIRTANWKMVFDPEQEGVCYLFDLLNDPQELRNLAGVPGYEGITARLQEHLLSFCIDLHQDSGPGEQAIAQKVRTMFAE